MVAYKRVCLLQAEKERMFEEQKKILEARKAGTNFSDKQDSKDKMKALLEREQAETAAAVKAAREMGVFGMSADEMRVRPSLHHAEQEVENLLLIMQ